MAWYTPSHACGHDGERIQLYGPGRERDKALESMGRHDCPDCRAKAAQERAHDTNMPVLTGSPKQIAWADDIRTQYLAVCTQEQTDEARKHTDAKWWIDNRFDIGALTRKLAISRMT